MHEYTNMGVTVRIEDKIYDDYANAMSTPINERIVKTMVSVFVKDGLAQSVIEQKINEHFKTMALMCESCPVVIEYPSDDTVRYRYENKYVDIPADFKEFYECSTLSKIDENFMWRLIQSFLKKEDMDSEELSRNILKNLKMEVGRVTEIPAEFFHWN